MLLDAVNGANEECVLKDTIVNLALALVLEIRRIMSFNTLPFFYPQEDKPSGRPPVQSMFKVRSRTSFPITLLRSVVVYDFVFSLAKC